MFLALSIISVIISDPERLRLTVTMEGGGGGRKSEIEKMSKLTLVAHSDYFKECAVVYIII